VSVVKHLGVIWFFHANFAGGGGLAAVNHGVNQTMIRNAGAIVGIPLVANYYFFFKSQSASILSRSWLGPHCC